MKQLSTNNSYILWQSAFYFAQKALPEKIEKIYSCIQQYDQILTPTENIPTKPLWQLPLGLLLNISDDSNLIKTFFEEPLALPNWYEHTFIVQTGSVLVLQQGIIPDSFPQWTVNTIPRFSPLGKDILKFRLNGFRCSVAEVLLFLAFTPFSRLIGSYDGQPEANCQELTTELDFLLFELYGNHFYIEDILHRNYREGLYQLWTQTKNIWGPLTLGNPRLTF